MLTTDGVCKAPKFQTKLENITNLSYLVKLNYDTKDI